MINHYIYTYRKSFTVIKLSGDRVLDYLQGQITQDVGKLSPQRAIYAAVLTPQGKMISDLILIDGENDEVIIVCPTYSAANLVFRLRQFMIGYQLRMGIVSSFDIISIQGAETDTALQAADLPCPDAAAFSVKMMNDCIILRMPEAASQGIWVIAPDNDLDALRKPWGSAVEESVMEDARIIYGTPRFSIDWDESTFPLNANLHELNGVSYEKGCYTGQEVTSRMHWRKSIKKRLYHVELMALPITLPCPISTTAKIGMLTSAACHEDKRIFGIAHLAIEAAESDKTMTLEDGSKVRILEACHAR